MDKMGYIKLDSRFNICIFHNFPQNASPSLDTLLGNSHKVHFVYIQCGYQLEGRGQRKGQKGGKRKDKGREEQNECIMNKRRFLHSSCRESATAVFFFFFPKCGWRTTCNWACQKQSFLNAGSYLQSQLPLGWDSRTCIFQEHQR